MNEDKLGIYRLILNLESARLESDQIPVEDAIIKMYDDMKLHAELADALITAQAAIITWESDNRGGCWSNIQLRYNMQQAQDKYDLVTKTGRQE
jgi:hypothetical protein